MPKSQASQKFVVVKEIRDGIVVLKTGGLRAILAATAVNFALKSTEEQQATIFQFQNYLNSLEFDTQLVIQSRRLDIRPYLATLEERLKQIPEELLRIQTREYIEFIKFFNEQVNVMDKRFYVVVPYTSAPLDAQKQTGFFASLGKPKQNQPTVVKSELAQFEENRSQLAQRVAVVTSGLSSFGVKVKQLDTKEAIELFYTTYNPGELAGGITQDAIQS